MAHRGNRVLCPENTLAAFRQALVDGADILETDLHLTADNGFVCIHDATVDRTTNGSGAVAQITLAEIKKLSAAYHFTGFEDEGIPSLTELAAILPGDVALALELKTSRFLEPDVCLKLVTELNQAGVRARTIVLSFHLEYLRAVQAVAADIPNMLDHHLTLLATNRCPAIGTFLAVADLEPILYIRGASPRPVSLSVGSHPRFALVVISPSWL